MDCNAHDGTEGAIAEATVVQAAIELGIHLRLGPTRNNQRRGINWAERFEVAATLSDEGAIAQLGERQSGTLEVTGSSPVGSISR